MQMLKIAAYSATAINVSRMKSFDEKLAMVKKRTEMIVNVISSPVVRNFPNNIPNTTVRIKNMNHLISKNGATNLPK
ncbi:hypothetical protein A2318_02265 [Candidatus Uhrbacteria bacterium RIFOXYB2_FULL_45_11]|uniref:Uncharacterized protein n=1 Tax=Candidatus Uhrbacteria bacterium RIFOXYB2_FULL_45_11 TaxID=1802421 RepID=A0A1F7WA59_9BACT|nr:MAG: hypothetical protein A2318_02265 [Candidatus Uhrbacteria bacterium RIFOXYB2_FULL_45_11]